MSASIATICDPSLGTLADSIRQAKSAAQAAAGFELDLCRFLHMRCFSNRPELPVIIRGIEVLDSITEEGKLLTLLRPFLKSSDPQIASKCVLLLGRRCQSVGWMRNVMAEIDDRIRANLVESLWGRNEPEIGIVLQSALTDKHHRVAANAIYGLYLLGSDLYVSGLDQLIGSRNPLCRRSAIWVIRMTGTTEAASRIKPLIRDPDSGVRHAAFEALFFLRKGATEKVPEAEPAVA